MEQITYERPRERLKTRGALALSNNELFQLILGSGSSKVSVAKLARKVAELFEQSTLLTYALLAEIPGLGDAKICQLLALSELMRRSNTGPGADPVGGSDSLDWLTPARHASRLTMAHMSLDGDGMSIKTRYHEIDATLHFTHIVKKVFADTISDQAAKCVIGFAYRRYTLKPDMLTLSIIKNAQDTAQILHIPLQNIYLANKDTARKFA